MLAKRMTKHYITFVSLVLVFLVILSTEARADLYGFAAISNNSGVSGAIATQLSLEVTDYGASGGYNRVLFEFINAVGPYDGIIGTVYFEDGALLGIAEILDAEFDGTLYPGVDFEISNNPESRNFPAGDTLDPPFETTAHFWSTNVQAIENGVNTGEKVGIVFNLEGGKNFADVIAAISLGFTNPDPGGNSSLRIGIHVQNLGEDGEFSDSFILTPIPASVILGILGLSVAGWKLRKFA